MPMVSARVAPAAQCWRLSWVYAPCVQVETLKAARAEAKGHAYREYALDKQLAFVSDPSNIAFEELELPQLIQVGSRVP